MVGSCVHARDGVLCPCMLRTGSCVHAIGTGPFVHARDGVLCPC